MHWFWITYLLWVTWCRANSLNLTTNSNVNRSKNNSLSLAPQMSNEGDKNVSSSKALLGSNESEDYSNFTQSKVNQAAILNLTMAHTTNIPLFDDNMTATYFDGENIYNHSLLISSKGQIIGEDEIVHTTENNDDTNTDVGTHLSVAGIVGIIICCLMAVGVMAGLSYMLYISRGLNRPQVLDDRCSNLNSSGYIDDASVRDNSEEMYNLDNDSFLNSLEAMTIQNYWTDTVKHTKL